MWQESIPFFGKCTQTCLSFSTGSALLANRTSANIQAEPPNGLKVITALAITRSSLPRSSPKCSVAHTDMAEHYPKSNRAINWAVLARNDERRLNRNCRGCKYLAQDYTCRYILDTNRSRVRQGIKMRPGGGCDLYNGTKWQQPSVRAGIVISKSLAKKLDPDKRIGFLDNNREAQEAAMALYEKGASDMQIGAHLGCSKQTVFNWRKANGLKSNYNKFRKENSL